MMPLNLTFLAPLGLLALAGLVAIVLIHMRQHTPPVIHLPSLRFWEPVREDALDRRRLRRPPITWPFVLQLAAALLIAVGLARPVMDALPGLASQRTTPQHTIVILDGSTSMLATTTPGGNTTHWELARQEARSVLDDWQAGDVVTVIVTGSRLHTSSASTRVQRDALRDRLASLAAPGGVADIEEALRLGGSLVLPDRENRVVVVTDGALRPNPAIAAAVPAPIELRLVGADTGDQANVAVTSIGYRPVTNRDDTYRISFAISAFTADPVRLPYRVEADGAEVVRSEIDVAPGVPRSVQVTLPAGAALAEVFVEVGDAHPADNVASILLGDATSAGLDVLLISDVPGPLERALAALPDARVDVFPATTPGIRALAVGYDLTVFHGITPLDDDVPRTPMLFVRPPQLGERFAASGVLTNPVIDRFDAGDPLLDGVDLAGVTFGDTPAYELQDGEEELVRGSANGLTGPLIWRGDLDGQRYVAYGFDLDASNITQRVAFPVLVARSVADVTTPAVPGVLDLGTPLLYPTSDLAAEVELVMPGGDTVVTSVQEGAGTVLLGDTGQAGIHTVRELGAGGQVLAETVIVINAGHATESDLRANPDLATALQGGDAAEPSAGAQGDLADLWPVLAGIAMVLVALEWAVFHGVRTRLPRLVRTGGAT